VNRARPARVAVRANGARGLRHAYDPVALARFEQHRQPWIHPLCHTDENPVVHHFDTVNRVPQTYLGPDPCPACAAVLAEMGGYEVIVGSRVVLVVIDGCVATVAGRLPPSPSPSEPPGPAATPPAASPPDIPVPHPRSAGIAPPRWRGPGQAGSDAPDVASAPEPVLVCAGAAGL